MKFKSNVVYISKVYYIETNVFMFSSITTTNINITSFPNWGHIKTHSLHKNCKNIFNRTTLTSLKFITFASFLVSIHCHDWFDMKVYFLYNFKYQNKNVLIRIMGQNLSWIIMSYCHVTCRNNFHKIDYNYI